MSLRDRYVGKIIELVEFDFSPIGGTVLRITNNAGGINWNGFTWQANPVDIADMSAAISGSAAVTAINVSNLTGLFTQNLVSTLDLVGAKITRYYIEASSIGTNDNPLIAPEVFTVTNISRTRSQISFEASTRLGSWNIELPSKKMLIKDYPALGRVY